MENKKLIKRNLIMLIAIYIIGVIVFIGLIFFFVKFLFSQQYNKNGVSHFLVISIDKDRPREYVGELENHKIYVENLKLEETTFRNIKAKSVSIKEALEKELVSIDDWKKYARNVINVEDTDIMQYENYEIACSDNDCIIRPLSI